MNIRAYSTQRLPRSAIRRAALSGAVIAVALAIAAPAHAALDADSCKRIANLGQDVYDQAIKNGMSAAAAEKSAQNTVKRRVHEESGTKISTMEDAVVACGATGLTNLAMCHLVSGYYTGSPC